MNLIPEIIETLFLDVGNTIISIDFKRMAVEIQGLGMPCDEETLQRAEAAARPVISQYIVNGSNGDTWSVFEYYLLSILNKLPSAETLDEVSLKEITGNLAALLHIPGQADLLWNRIIPGAIEALECFRRKGFQLVAVSNSDGTVEKSLKDLHVRDYFSVVVDSHLIGYEKPDPRIFNHALEKSGARPGTTLHVGDLYHADILGARRAGLSAVLLDPYNDWPQADCPRCPDLLSLSRII